MTSANKCSFESTELYNYEKLKYIVEHFNDMKLPKEVVESWELNGMTYDPLEMLREYISKSKNLYNTGMAHVEYRYTGIHKKDHKGRQYSVGALSMQSFSRWIRGTVTDEIYYDIDIVNCHPTLLSQYCHKKDIKCPLLDYYVEHRDECLQELVTKYPKINKDDAKRMYITVMYGGSVMQTTEFFKKFKIEMYSTIQQTIMKMQENAELKEAITQSKLSKKSNTPLNIEGSLTSHVIDGIENDILLSAIEYLHKISVSTSNIILTFDGFMIPRDAINLDESFYNGLSDHIYNAVGYRVKHIHKPQKDIITLPEIELAEEFELAEECEMKSITVPQPKKGPRVDVNILRGMMHTDAEGKHVMDIKQVVEYLNNYHIDIRYLRPPCYIEFSDEYDGGYNIGMYSQSEHHLASYKSFFKVWSISPYKRSVTTITNIPYLKDKPDCGNNFNVFPGFMHKYDPNFKVDMSLIEDWLNIINHIWCCDDKELCKYLMSWFAHKIQKPATKIGVAIVCKSIMEGAGKNTLFEMIAKCVIGNRMCFQVGDNDQLFEKFNSRFEKTLLVMCDEIGSMGSAYKKADKLKCIITRTEQFIENKGQEGYMMPDYNDYLLFSNNDWIVKCGSSDRRYLCLELSNDYVGRHDYWRNIYSKMTPAVGKHLFHYLANYDISDFELHKIPMTEWKRTLKRKSFDDTMNMLIRFVDKRLKCNDTKFQVFEFMEVYESMPKDDGKDRERLSSKQLSDKIRPILGITEEHMAMISKNGRKCRGYMITIPQIMERIRLAVRDPKFQFGVDDAFENGVKVDENIEKTVKSSTTQQKEKCIFDREDMESDGDDGNAGAHDEEDD